MLFGDLGRARRGVMGDVLVGHGYDSCFRYDRLPAKFTGKERDAETGLDYFGARYFSGAQGRFTGRGQPEASGW